MSKNPNQNQPYQSSSSIPGADDLQGRYEKALNDLRRARGEGHFLDLDNAQDRAALENAGFVLVSPSAAAEAGQSGPSQPAHQSAFRRLLNYAKI